MIYFDNIDYMGFVATFFNIFTIIGAMIYHYDSEASKKICWIKCHFIKAMFA